MANPLQSVRETGFVVQIGGNHKRHTEDKVFGGLMKDQAASISVPNGSPSSLRYILNKDCDIDALAAALQGQGYGYRWNGHELVYSEKAGGVASHKRSFYRFFSGPNDSQRFRTQVVVLLKQLQSPSGRTDEAIGTIAIPSLVVNVGATAVTASVVTRDQAQFEQALADSNYAVTCPKKGKEWNSVWKNSAIEEQTTTDVQDSTERNAAAGTDVAASTDPQNDANIRALQTAGYFYLKKRTDTSPGTEDVGSTLFGGFINVERQTEYQDEEYMMFRLLPAFNTARVIDHLHQKGYSLHRNDNENGGTTIWFEPPRDPPAPTLRWQYTIQRPAGGDQTELDTLLQRLLGPQHNVDKNVTVVDWPGKVPTLQGTGGLTFTVQNNTAAMAMLDGILRELGWQWTPSVIGDGTQCVISKAETTVVPTTHKEVVDAAADLAAEAAAGDTDRHSVRSHLSKDGKRHGDDHDYRDDEEDRHSQHSRHSRHSNHHSSYFSSQRMQMRVLRPCWAYLLVLVPMTVVGVLILLNEAGVTKFKGL